MSALRFFHAVVSRPWWVLTPLGVLLLASLAAMTGLQKDTRSDAFLAPDNPALVYRDLVREQFGLSDPLLLALVADGERGIYTPAILRALAELTQRVAALPNVDADNTLSLATEPLIEGTSAGIEVVDALETAFRLLYRKQFGLDRAREELRAQGRLIPQVNQLLDFLQTQQEGRNGRGRDIRRAA